MLRRNQRLRKEYLYRKGLEGKEKAAYERKRLLRKALEEGKPIPTELRNDEQVGACGGWHGLWRSELVAVAPRCTWRVHGGCMQCV